MVSFTGTVMGSDCDPYHYDPHGFSYSSGPQAPYAVTTTTTYTRPAPRRLVSLVPVRVRVRTALREFAHLVAWCPPREGGNRQWRL